MAAILKTRFLPMSRFVTRFHIFNGSQPGCWCSSNFTRCWRLTGTPVAVCCPFMSHRTWHWRNGGDDVTIIGSVQNGDDGIPSMSCLTWVGSELSSLFWKIVTTCDCFHWVHVYRCPRHKHRLMQWGDPETGCGANLILNGHGQCYNYNNPPFELNWTWNQVDLYISWLRDRPVNKYFLTFGIYHFMVFKKNCIGLYGKCCCISHT